MTLIETVIKDMPINLFWKLFHELPGSKAKGELLAHGALNGIISNKHARQTCYFYKGDERFTSIIVAYTTTKNKLLELRDGTDQ
jgi:hypothetical protein